MENTHKGEGMIDDRIMTAVVSAWSQIGDIQHAYHQLALLWYNTL